MTNTEYKKLIAEKTIGNIKYSLFWLINDKLFAIFSDNLRENGVHAYPEIFRSNNEKEAKDYFENLS